METTVRWRSWLGASVIFFLIFGVINVASLRVNLERDAHRAEMD